MYFYGKIRNHIYLNRLKFNNNNIIFRFWLIILAVLSACALIYSAVILMMPTSRETVIKRRFRTGKKKEVQGLLRRLQVRF